MFKKRMTACILVVVILLSSTIAIGETFASYINKTRANEGLITIGRRTNKDVKMKVMVVKGKDKYTYNLNSKDSFPLQFGDGKYTVSVLENVVDNKYRVLEKQDILYRDKDKTRVFTHSIQNINWSKDMEAMKIARELTKGLKTDKEKVEVIYEYIINNISYDHTKVNTVQTDYLPDLDAVLKSTEGICYDYASLLAGMLRSLDIPTKMLMGRKNDVEVYHAWNEVYLKDTKEWVAVDTTYDAVLVQNKLDYSMIKDKKDYVIEKEY